MARKDSRSTIVVSVNAAWNLVNFRHSLLKSLVDAGYRVVAVAPPDGRERELAAIGVEFLPIAIERQGASPVADLKVLATYVWILRGLRPRAYLGFTIKPNVYGGIACRLLGIPRIANVAGLGTTFMQRGALNWIVRRLYAAGLGGAQRVFFQNADDRAHFLAEGLVKERRTALLPGSGVDLERFSPTSRPADGRTVFVLVARLLRAKGIAEYIEAASILRQRHGSKVHVMLLGIPDHSAHGFDPATIDASGEAVELLDEVSDVRPVLAAADCVVLPSYYPEGTPRSLLEAAAMGKPIITTNMPGCRNVVDDGINGFLCEPRSVSALTHAMEAYVDLDTAARERMGKASRMKAEREFDEQIVLSRYAQELTSFRPS